MEEAPNLSVAEEDYDQSNEETFRFELQDLLQSIVLSMNYISAGVGVQSISRHTKLKQILPPIGFNTYG
jgi:hypothetical protein